MPRKKFPNELSVILPPIVNKSVEIIAKSPSLPQIRSSSESVESTAVSEKSTNGMLKTSSSVEQKKQERSMLMENELIGDEKLFSSAESNNNQFLLDSIESEDFGVKCFSNAGRRAKLLFPSLKNSNPVSVPPKRRDLDETIKALPFKLLYATVSQEMTANLSDPATKAACFKVFQMIIMREGSLIRALSVARALDNQYWKYSFLRIHCIQKKKSPNIEKLVAKKKKIWKLQQELSVAIAHLRSISISFLESVSSLRSLSAKITKCEYLLSVFWQESNYIQKMAKEMAVFNQYLCVKVWLGFEPNALMVPPMDHNPELEWRRSLDKYEEWLRLHHDHLLAEKRRAGKGVTSVEMKSFATGTARGKGALLSVDDGMAIENSYQQHGMHISSFTISINEDDGAEEIRFLKEGTREAEIPSLQGVKSQVDCIDGPNEFSQTNASVLRQIDTNNSDLSAPDNSDLSAPDKSDLSAPKNQGRQFSNCVEGEAQHFDVLDNRSQHLERSPVADLLQQALESDELLLSSADIDADELSASSASLGGAGVVGWKVLRDYCARAWFPDCEFEDGGIGDNEQYEETILPFWEDPMHLPLVVEAALGFEDVFPLILLVPQLPANLRRKCSSLERIIREEDEEYERLSIQIEQSKILQSHVTSTATLSSLQDIINGSRFHESSTESLLLKQRQQTDLGSVGEIGENCLRLSSFATGAPSMWSLSTFDDSRDQIFEMTSAAGLGSVSLQTASSSGSGRPRQGLLCIDESSLKTSSSARVLDQRRVTKVDVDIRSVREGVREKPLDQSSNRWRQHCALVIQCAVRQHLAKKIVRQIRRTAYESTAVVLIQRMLRGMVGRARVRKMRRRFRVESFILTKLVLRRNHHAKVITRFFKMITIHLKHLRIRKRLAEREARREKAQRSIRAEIKALEHSMLRDHQKVITPKSPHMNRNADHNSSAVEHFLPDELGLKHHSFHMVHINDEQAGEGSSVGSLEPSLQSTLATSPRGTGFLDDLLHSPSPSESSASGDFTTYDYLSKELELFCVNAANSSSHSRTGTPLPSYLLAKGDTRRTSRLMPANLATPMTRRRAEGSRFFAAPKDRVFVTGGPGSPRPTSLIAEPGEAYVNPTPKFVSTKLNHKDQQPKAVAGNAVAQKSQEQLRNVLLRALAI